MDFIIKEFTNPRTNVSTICIDMDEISMQNEYKRNGQIVEQRESMTQLYEQIR